MWAELPENKHNDAPKNERIYESDLPTFTTDVRMGKVDGIFKSGWGRGGPEEIRGSGGGGAVEALWWIKDTGTQWRIKGQAFVVAPEIEGEGKQSEGIETLKSEVGERMRKVKEGNWSWGKELTAHFGNCSPKMRGKHGFRHWTLLLSLIISPTVLTDPGTWKNPFPGAPVADVPPDDKHKLGQSITDLHDSVARKNFRVVIIKPVEVEQLDISDPAKARRWKYSYIRGNHNDNKADAADEGDWEWQTEELWP